MREKGQVFTFDMLFALMLAGIVLFVSVNAYDTAMSRTRGYVTRVSLERQANDVLDALVTSPGIPQNWEDDISNLETLGLAKINEDGEKVVNFVDTKKLSRLMTKTREQPIDDSIKKFFGTNQFEIKITRGDEVLWHFWPGHLSEGSSNAGNAAEVATTSRLIWTKPGDVRWRSDPLFRWKAGDMGADPNENEFQIYQGELDTHDWYAVVRISKNLENRPREVTVKVQEGGKQFIDTWDAPITGEDLPTENVLPKTHGGMESVSDNPKVGINRIRVTVKKSSADAYNWAEVRVVGLPHCSDPSKALEAGEKKPAVMQIKVWR